MEDSWVYIDDNSSNSSLADSDKIDSETEAELYSRLHHEPNLSFINPENLNEQPTGLLLCSASEDFFYINKQNNESNLDTTDHLLLNMSTTNNFSNGKRKSSEIDVDCKIFSEELILAKKPKVKSMCQGQNVNIDSNDYEAMNESSKFVITTIQNKNTVCISNNETKTVKQESSDSDSDIWIEESSVEKSDLKINLLKDTDTIFLSSSDSENESDISSPFKKRDSFLRNLSMPIIKTEENSKGLWYINSEDLRRSKKQSRRYHDNFDIVCSNCHKKGHTFRICPSPRVIKCFLCGGNHMGCRCSKRVCSNCHSIGHDRKNCQRKISRAFCHLCSMVGHAQENCPDIWRRYHLTTEANRRKLKKGKQVKQIRNLYCWNCGKGGHFGAICQLARLSRNSFSTLPCVISYRHPRQLLKLRLNILKKYSYLNKQNLNRSINNNSNASPKHRDNLRPDFKLNVSSGSNEENRGNKKGGRKFRTAFRFDKIPDIVNRNDFPRTPKKSPNKCSSTLVKSEEETKSPYLLMKTQLMKLKRRFNQAVKKHGVQACKSATQNDVSRALNEESRTNFDADLPQSLKIQAERKFQRWKKNRLRRLQQKQNKPFTQEEILKKLDVL